MHQVRLPTSNLVVVLPDSHAHPDLDNSRFSALGNMLLELIVENPTKEVCLLNLGDMADMPSLSSYDKGKRSFEGRRYWKDVEAVVDAQEKLFAPLLAYNKNKARSRKKQLTLRTVHTLGNHDEGRIYKVTQLHPELEGTISIDNLQYDKYWDVVVPFKDVVDLNGVAVSHYFATGLRGMPISGDNPARTMLLKNHMSSIQGHSHVWDIKELSSVTGEKMFGLVGGCYVHDEMVEEWNKDTVHFWNNCITVLTDVNNGSFKSMAKISAKALIQEYAG